MNLKCRLILEDYRKQRADFITLGDTVHTMLSNIVKDLGLTVLAVEHRVKEEKSLAGKLERKGDSYNTLEDITDILGCRVVCFLSDEIDKILLLTGKTLQTKERLSKRMLLDICPFITYVHFLLEISGLMKFAERSLKYR